MDSNSTHGIAFHRKSQSGTQQNFPNIASASSNPSSFAVGSSGGGVGFTNGGGGRRASPVSSFTAMQQLANSGGANQHGHHRTGVTIADEKQQNENDNRNQQQQQAPFHNVGILSSSQQSILSPRKYAVKDVRSLFEAVSAAYRLALEEEERARVIVAASNSGCGSLTSQQSPPQSGPPLLITPPSAAITVDRAAAAAAADGAAADALGGDTPSSYPMLMSASSRGNNNANGNTIITVGSLGKIENNTAQQQQQQQQASLMAANASNTKERQRLAQACQNLLDAVLSDTPNGVDYKTIAAESTAALELLLKMVKSDLSLAKHLAIAGGGGGGGGKGMIPVDALEPKIKALRELLEETSKKYGLQLGGGDSGLTSLLSPHQNQCHEQQGGTSNGVTVPSIAVVSGTPLQRAASLVGANGSTSNPLQGKGFNVSTGIIPRSGSLSNVPQLSSNNNANVTTPNTVNSIAATNTATTASSAVTPKFAPSIIGNEKTPIDPSELYDVRLLFVAGGWHETEPEDQNALLRGTISRLSREKMELQGELETMEKQMQHLRERLSRESDKALRSQQQIEVDLRHLTTQLGLTSNNASPVENNYGANNRGGASVTSPGYNSSASHNNHHLLQGNATTANNNNNAVGADSFEAKRANKRPMSADASPTRGLQNLSIGGNNAFANSANFSRPANASTASGGVGAGAGASISNRYQKLEALYYNLYEGRGMEMIWNVIDTVYRCEFEAPAVSGSSPIRVGGASRTAPLGAASPSSPSSAVTPEKKQSQEDNDKAMSSLTASPAEQSPSSTAAANHAAADHNTTFFDPYKSFHDLFNAFIVQPLSSENSFNAAVRNVTPLRSDYVANCLAHRIKANSGVVKLLSCATSDARVTELNLDGNYIGDNGLIPLVPLFARMHNLTSLRLAHNGLRNDGVLSLTKAIMIHPSIASIDLSHNSISRTGGKQLLSLVATCPRITFVGLEGTPMDTALRGRIEAAALNNKQQIEARHDQQRQALVGGGGGGVLFAGEVSAL